MRPVQALPDLHPRGGSRPSGRAAPEVVVHEEQVAHLLGSDSQFRLERHVSCSQLSLAALCSGRATAARGRWATTGVNFTQFADFLNLAQGVPFGLTANMLPIWLRPCEPHPTHLFSDVFAISTSSPSCVPLLLKATRTYRSVR